MSCTRDGGGDESDAVPLSGTEHDHVPCHHDTNHDNSNFSSDINDDDPFLLTCAESMQPRRSTHDGTVRHPAVTFEVGPPPRSAPGATRRRRVQWAPDVVSPNLSRELLHKRARLIAEADERAALLRQQEAANEELGRGKRRKSRP